MNLRKKNKHRVVISPLETGFMVDVCAGLSEIGIPCTHYAFWKDKFGNPDNYKNKSLDKYFYFVNKSNESKKKNRWGQARLWQIPEMLVVLSIFIKELFRSDTFIYIYERGMFFTSYYLKKHRELEFKILKLFKKKIIFWNVGSDSRPPYCGASYYLGENPSAEQLYTDACRIFEDVRISEKYGILIDMAASAHFHRKPYIDFLAVGLPICSNDKRYYIDIEKEEREKVVIVHAPSNTEVKGTNLVRDTINQLRQEGYHIQYEELIGKKNDEVIKKLKTADIAIDQVYIDTPCARFAEEACICGVPVIVGSYIYEDFKAYTNCEIPPTVICHPNRLKDSIEYLINHKMDREKIGKAEQKFIKENWDAKNVAERILQIIDGNIPENWWVNPEKEGAVSGGGSSWERTCRNIEKLIDQYGMEGLLLSKKQKLYGEYQKIYKILKEK